MKVLDIRSIERPDGRYVRLADVLLVLRTVFRLFPSRVSVFIYKIFEKGVIRGV
jgi:hypothetical protein